MATAADKTAAPAPGSSGIGDAYWPLDGNGGIDVAAYKIKNRYDVPRQTLQGRTKLTLTATADLSSFNLDFLLPVSKVKVDGVAAEVDQTSHELTITPAAPLTTGSNHTVTVKYAGRPATERYAGEGNWLANGREAVAMNQPHMATRWFPANDHPSDKALFDISTTVPTGREVIANGNLVGKKKSKRGTTRRWRADEPMASYLAFFAAGDFAIQKGTSNGLPWVNAVSQQLSADEQKASLKLLGRTPGIVEALEGDLGAYPFSVTGGLTTGLSVFFALENQTRPTYPYVGSDNVRPVVHELAHQWFGDDVAIARWRDIWLNEGAATFMEWRYAEQHGDRSAADTMRAAYDSPGTSDRFWQLVLTDPGAAHIFDTPVYDRGGMTLRALRNRIGEEKFWLLIRTRLETKAGGNATSEEFEALAAQVSGRDLTGFFTARLRTPAKPAATAENGLA
ncbi:M1 family metallopeptidase [Nocardioides sp. B-3]|uniref:M1 family metallopeptidase n=1 Tax=Nocardioides sp. B-3 TaxID=2895565 RepID=UPI002153A420|nr:M1 family metallopeptidase [Nocardioides sp. B-3]UUZ59794.1 M1 family metallopeptidase [Nocardioides sp. B-3]